MKFLLFLLPLFISLQSVIEHINESDAITYEFTVKTPNAAVETFSLKIVGKTKAANGKTTSYRLNKKNLSTPYQLHLPSGKYEIITIRNSDNKGMVSKVQGLKNGEEWGSSESGDKKTILRVNGGYYYADGEN